MANLQADQLFLGLTRPLKILGVHYMMFIMNAFGMMLFYINTRAFVEPFIMGIFIHLVLYLVCLKEDRAIDIIMARFGKCSKCKNRAYHKFTNSYDLN